jgi:hypothetical protein
VKFEKTQRLDGTVEEVEKALLSDDYLLFLLKHHGVLLEVQLLDKKEDGSKVTRKVRYRPKPVIESIGPKTVPPEWFAFVESSTWDKSTHIGRFTNTPTSNKISSMLLNTGTIRLRDAGGGKTDRTMDGEINLKLPFLLKLLAPIGEAVIQREGLKILDNEAPVMNRFIAEVLRAK